MSILEDALGQVTAINIGISAQSGTLTTGRNFVTSTAACYVKFGGGTASSGDYDILVPADAAISINVPQSAVSVIQVGATGVVSFHPVL